MSMDPITETIAHFVGFFELAVEEARGRLDYDEFRALKAEAEEEEALQTVKYSSKESYQLRDVHPDLRYLPFDQEVVSIKASSHAGGVYIPTASTEIAAPGPDPSLRLDGFMFPMEAKTVFIGTPPGSAAVLTKQANSLSDNDYLTMTDAAVDTMPVGHFESGLATLAEEAASLDPVGELTMPASEEAIGGLVEDIAQIIKSDLGSGTEPDGPAEITILKGSETDGVHWNGALVDEAPDLEDYRPGDEPDDEGEAEPVSFVEGEGEIVIDAHVTLDTGSNLLVNEALIANNWIVAPVIAAAGDAIDVNLISQVNVWCDMDSIGAEFSNWVADDSAPTAGFNIAAFTSETTSPEDEGTDAPAAFPEQWSITRLEGNLVFLDWIEQLNFVNDHDTTIMTKVGSQTMVQMGGNTLINAFSALELGQHFDLIVASGGYYHANIISQMNVLLDNDFIWAENGFQSSAEASLSTGDNLLWNQASIHTVGQTSFDGMPAHYMEAIGSLANGGNHVSADILTDSAFAGLGTLNVLYLGGSIFDFQYISQTNILGDSDQIAMYEETLAEGMDNGWTVTTGSNDLINIASIVDAGVDGTVYAGGEIYSDALLYQAELISDDPLGELGDPSDLASEAVVFLAEGMLDADIGDDDDGAMAADQPDATHVDVMQTMLA